MRISNDPDSPFFSAAAAMCDVTIDGIRCARCVEADEESGTAWIADGTQDELERVQGEVRIIVPAVLQPLVPQACFG